MIVHHPSETLAQDTFVTSQVLLHALYLTSARTCVVEVEDGYLSNAVVQLNCGATWHIVAYKAVAQGLHMRYVSACQYQALRRFVVHTCLNMFSAQASDAACQPSFLYTSSLRISGHHHHDRASGAQPHHQTSSPSVTAVAQFDIVACISCGTQPRRKDRRYAPGTDFGNAWDAHGKSLTTQTAPSPAPNHPTSAFNIMCIGKLLPAASCGRCLVPARLLAWTCDC